MFRIFENWDGSFTVMPFDPADSLIGLVFGFVFVLLMSIVAGYASLYMTLPVVALYISVLIDMYIPSEASVYISYPFAAYAWGGTCYAIMEATRVHGLGLLGLAGWLIMAIAGIVLLIIPLGERTESEIIPFLAVIPLGMLWIGAILYGLADAENGYYSVSSNLCKYAFRIFGIMMLAGLAYFFYLTARRSFRTGSASNATGSFFNLLLGCALIAGASFVSSIAEDMYSALFVLLALAAMSFILRGSKKLSLNGYSVLPAAICLIAQPFSTGSSADDILPLSAADHIRDLFQTEFFSMLADRFTLPFLRGLDRAVSTLLRVMINLVLRIFDTSVPSFSIPLLIMTAVAFILMCLAAGAGKTKKRR